MNLRTLTKAELEGKNNGEYVISVDVARSTDESNNRCSASILKIKRNNVGKIIKIQLVNLVDIPATKNFRAQAQDVMKLRAIYDAKRVVVDSNGLGQGLVDELLHEQIDENGESLGCWDTMNTSEVPEDPSARDYVYSLKSQGINHDVIVNFVNTVEGEKLQLLEKRVDNSYANNDSNHIKKEVLPFVSTDMLLEELANLKLKQTSNQKMTVEKQTRSINADRYSALAYGLYYISEYEDDFSKAQEGNMSDYLLIN